MQNTVLWIYIVLLLIGGLIGFYKGRSQVSLIMSVLFAGALVVCLLPGVFQPGFAHNTVNVLLTALVVVFAIRLAKTKKFMPAGMMFAITILVLALRNISF